MRNLVRKIYRRLKHIYFRHQWRNENKHNKTYPARLFDKSKVSVGNYTYGPLNIFAWGAPDESLTIGHCVSIASGVKFLLGGNHYYNRVATFSFPVEMGLLDVDCYSKGPIIVEDDVWIGMDVTIMSGVTISKGAIVATNSVVTRDIAPYSVWGGYLQAL